MSIQTAFRLPGKLYPSVELDQKLESDNSPINQYINQQNGKFKVHAKWLAGRVAQKSTRNLLRKKFTLPSPNDSVKLQIKSFDCYSVYVNGILVGANLSASGNSAEYGIDGYIRQGENLLSIELFDNGSPRGTRGEVEMNNQAQNISSDYD